jgi:hypothetical protein
MKKIVTLSAIALVAVGALTSCKKDYKCTYPTDPNSATSGVVLEYNDVPKHGVDGIKAGCEGGGGKWSVK